MNTARAKWMKWVMLAALATAGAPAAALAGAYQQLGHGPPAEPPPPKAVIEQVGIDQKRDAQVPPDLVFKDERGKEVHLGDYFGKRPVVLSLMYFGCPMLCPMELNGLTGCFKLMSLDVGKDFDVVTVSFDPTDTPDAAAEQKAKYLKDYDRPTAEQGWHFLTGDPKSIAALTQAVGFRYYKDPRTGQYGHSSGIMVLTPAGRISKYFYGIDYSPRDLKLGIVDAGKGKVGSIADQLLLLCYHYDPTKAKYGLAIMRMLQTGGVLIMGGIGGFVLVSLRRERRQARNGGGSPPADGEAAT